MHKMFTESNDFFYKSFDDLNDIEFIKMEE